jgi:hypothetical protein
MPPDYEKLTENIPVGGSEPERTIEPEELFEQSRQYLPVDHPKYQSLAEQKGYDQDPTHGNRLQKVRYTHDAMIDILLAEPTIQQKELAKRFDMSEAWISRIIGSDAFQAALAKRRDDVANPIIAASIDDKLSGLVNQSLEIIAEKLETSRSLDTAFKGLEIGVKALGFGARQSGGNNQQNNFTIVLPTKSANSAEWAEDHGMKRVG